MLFRELRTEVWGSSCPRAQEAWHAGLGRQGLGLPVQAGSPGPGDIVLPAGASQGGVTVATAVQHRTLRDTGLPDSGLGKQLWRVSCREPKALCQDHGLKAALHGKLAGSPLPELRVSHAWGSVLLVRSHQSKGFSLGSSPPTSLGPSSA